MVVLNFFGLYLYLEGRCCKNSLSARGPAHSKSGPVITWLVGTIIYCSIFQLQFTSTLPDFTKQNTFKKLATVWEMLIEQIIKFESKGPGPPGRTCNPI